MVRPSLVQVLGTVNVTLFFCMPFYLPFFFPPASFPQTLPMLFNHYSVHDIKLGSYSAIPSVQVLGVMAAVCPGIPGAGPGPVAAPLMVCNPIPAI